MSCIVYGSKSVFPEPNTSAYSAKLIPLAILFCVQYVAFSMALSTFFRNPKVADNVGQMLLYLPVIVFLQCAQKIVESKVVIYIFMWVPMFPTCTLFVKWS